MAAVVWTELRGPGVVTWARPGPDGTVIAVGTDGGHLYLRLHTAAGADSTGRCDGAGWG